MAEEDDGEPKYQMFVPGSDAPRAEGSRSYTGDGRAQYVNGDQYEGTFVEGYRRGKGKYTFKKFGDTYEGHYEENKKHGFGKMSYLNKMDEGEEEGEEAKAARGGTYLGYFTKGDRGCQARDAPEEAMVDGTFTYITGDVYSGAWRAGKKHGKGTYSFAKDSTKLVGEWENGKIVNGKWIFPNGTFYVGKFRYNKPFGKGVWVFKNGNQLTGDYDQKEQPAEDEGGGGEEEEGVEKPDPKVWCIFKHGRDVAVQGGSMTGMKYPPAGYPPKA